MRTFCLRRGNIQTTKSEAGGRLPTGVLLKNSVTESTQKHICKFSQIYHIIAFYSGAAEVICAYQNEKEVIHMTNRTDTFRLHYEVTGEQRKALVKAISRIMNAAAHYEGAPSFNYTVDYVTIEKDGTVSFDARADSDEIETLIDGLAEAGFEPQNSETETVTEQPELPEEPHAAEAEQTEQPEQEAEPYADEAETETEQTEQTGEAELPDDSEQPKQEDETEPHASYEDTSGWLTISMPKGADFSVMAELNLRRLLENKGTLIRKALGAARLDFETDDEDIIFPWWDEKPANWDFEAFMLFLTSLLSFAKKLNRINGGSREAENEKYAFRCFLLRLGFIGDQYKAARKALLKNLEGSSAFRTPAE